jgi:carboxylesterase
MKKTSIYLFLLFLLQLSCKKEDNSPPINDAVDLDGMQVNDSSLANPERFLVSAAYSLNNSFDKEKPVIITAHGFTASTFEWLEFAQFAASDNDFYVSRVLLGGHGRNFEAFKNSRWEDWQQPIINEYNLLRNLGFKNISLAGASTGCPLILNAIKDNKINTDVLSHVFFIDPIVIPSNKDLSLIGALGSTIGYVATTMEVGEDGFWYKYRPYQALQQLNDFTIKTRKDLEQGIVLPDDVTMTVYKSREDGSADPLSAVLLKKGVKRNNGEEIKVKILDSNVHVLTRLTGRNIITANDRKIQQEIFNEIKQAL